MSTRALLAACERLGVPTDALLFAAGLDPTRVADLPRAASFAEIVEATLRRAIGDELDLAQTATRLGTTTRTLQRRLADEGTSFALVRDRARHAAALRLLCQPDVSLGEVSFLLGFSQPSAFNRAFRRWQGTTPLRFRSGVAADAA